MVNVIIVGQNAPFGVLDVDEREPRDFNANDIAFLQTYANLRAAAIERVRSHKKLSQGASEQAILVRELGHRARNLLGLVRALATQTSTTDHTAEQFRSAFIGRLMALSVAEGIVFESSGDRADPLPLPREVLAPFRDDDPKK